MKTRRLLACLALSPALAFAAPPMETLNKYACVACHGMTQKVLGPGFKEIAARYQDQKDAKAVLSVGIRAGGVGKWGQVPMPPQPAITDAELDAVVDWLMTGAKP